MQNLSKSRNKDQPHAGILTCTYLFLYGSQLRHATPVNRNYRIDLPRTISRTQQFYSALRSVRRRFTSLPGALYCARLPQRGLLRRQRFSRWPPPAMMGGGSWWWLQAWLTDRKKTARGQRRVRLQHHPLVSY